MFQIKKSIIILFALVLMSEFTNANSNSRYQIIIDISQQRLYLFEKEVLKQSFPVSTSSFGEGSIENSFKTRLGLHQIKSKIGTNVPINTIFIARENTNKKAKIINDKIDSADDFVTSRILWLDGLEIGKNITNTPTIIFLKNSNEENRIVEFPYENLEKDIYKIINNMGYKNVYYSE